MTPEEQAQQESQMQAQAESLQMQRESAMAALDEQRAKVREINARAAKLESDAAMSGWNAQGTADMQSAIMQVRQEAAQEIDRLSEALRKAQADLANQTLRIRTDADTKLEVARIDANAKREVADIQAQSDRAIAALRDKLGRMESTQEANSSTNKQPKPTP